MFTTIIIELVYDDISFLVMSNFSPCKEGNIFYCLGHISETCPYIGTYVSVVYWHLIEYSGKVHMSTMGVVIFIMAI